MTPRVFSLSLSLSLEARGIGHVLLSPSKGDFLTPFLLPHLPRASARGLTPSRHSQFLLQQLATESPGVWEEGGKCACEWALF